MWKNKIKNLFQNREIPPERDLWAALEAQLDQREAKAVRPKAYFRIWHYAVAASVLLAVAIGVFYERISLPAAQQPPITTVATEDKTPNAPLDTPPNVVAPAPVVVPQPTAPAVADKVANTTITTAKKSDQALDEEVDALLADVSTEALLAEVIQQLEKEQLAAKSREEQRALQGLKSLSPQELLLMATTEEMLDNYVDNNYPTDKLLSEAERDLMKERVQKFLNKIVAQWNNVKYALK
ncbi:hypothetical protein [Capnocytophaga leadbetteri]|jgi:hypothetical protein|uniref:hypothetical protein n=1 Tax=Capnocytophaga leadbetteri TaxID=327575 RepID=UPI0028D8568F|nr:hypothetical protein [Capnocytophaga leadbetteri]